MLKNYRSIFWLLFASSILLMVMQIFALLPNLKLLYAGGLFEFSMGTWIVFRGVLACLLVHITLWALLALALCVAVYFINQLIHLSDQNRTRLALGLWTSTVLAIFLANQYFFPRSMFAYFARIFFPQSLSYIFLLVMLSFLAAVSALVLAGALKKMSTKPLLLSSIIGLIIAAIFIPKSYINPINQKENKLTAPNIIIISIDSLRPDYIDFFSHKHLQLTPNLDRFLSESINYTNAMTTMGRTFPAWNSILSGEYPIHNGARVDLINQAQVKVNRTMAWKLKHLGYNTVYATDEIRFSNINSAYGFDKFIVPKGGVNAFLLAKFQDFPLSNLISNTRWGKWLFPYIYSNRASNRIYYPRTFSQELRTYLRDNLPTKPLFLALHFNLAHLPYLWANSSMDKLDMVDKAYYEEPYTYAIRAVDQQFGKLLDDLNNQGLLEHSLVFVLSDHGESLGLPGDRVTSVDKYMGPALDKNDFYQYALLRGLNISFGHGTDVLSMSQNHVLLSMWYKGLKDAAPIKSQQINSRVSLIDIYPTILASMRMQPEERDGVSLWNIADNIPVQLSLDKRYLFLESGLRPVNRAMLLDLVDLTKFAVNNYEIDPVTGYVSVQPKMLEKFIANKQLAVMYGDWFLALYPHPQGSQPITVLVNLVTKQWDSNLAGEFAKSSPAAIMLAKLRKFYAIPAQAGIGL